MASDPLTDAELQQFDDMATTWRTSDGLSDEEFARVEICADQLQAKVAEIRACRHAGATVHPLAQLADRVHVANKKWWVSLDTGQPINRNVGELLMLVVSELAEALEGHRKGLMDDKLPHRPMFDVEIADTLIRLLDLSAGMGLDLAGAFEEKMRFNASRIDHTLAHRAGAGGKKY